MGRARILVVDDEETIVRTLRAYLEPEGFAVYTADDGPGALSPTTRLVICVHWQTRR
jgi:CheY-like chemotaxis protein